MAGFVSSPWWWGDGALLAGLAGLAVWRDRQRGQQLRTLRQHTELPEPPTEGVHRLVDGERTRDLAAADRAALELTIRKPWGGGTTISSTMVRINGALVPSEWGHNRFLVPAGTLTVSVWIVYLSEYGRATTTLTLPAGDQTELHYSPPALTLLDGRIGPDPQRSPGARGLAVFALAFVALLVVLIVLFP